MNSFIFNMFNSNLNQMYQPSLQTHVKNIYSCIALSILAAGTGGYVHHLTGLGIYHYLIAGLIIDAMEDLLFTHYDRENTVIRLILLLLFAFFSGLGWGPLLSMAITAEPTVIPIAFFTTSLTFTCITLSSVFRYQPLNFYHGFTPLYLMSNFQNFLAGSSYLWFKTPILVGLAVMSVCIIYDTQMFVAARRNGDRDYIFHSAILFMHFIVVFQCLLVILTDREKQKQKNSMKSSYL